jgi:hypothetical protein
VTEHVTHLFSSSPAHNRSPFNLHNFASIAQDWIDGSVFFAGEISLAQSQLCTATRRCGCLSNFDVLPVSELLPNAMGHVDFPSTFSKVPAQAYVACPSDMPSTLQTLLTLAHYCLSGPCEHVQLVKVTINSNATSSLLARRPRCAVLERSYCAVLCVSLLNFDSILLNCS